MSKGEKNLNYHTELHTDLLTGRSVLKIILVTEVKRNLRKILYALL